MRYAVLAAVAVFHVFHHIVVESSGRVDCDGDIRPVNLFNLRVSSVRNQSGDWVTDFSLGKDDPSNDVANNVMMDLSQMVTECDGKRKMHIRGVLTGISSNLVADRLIISKDKLRFHTRCGSNAAILKDGRTVQRINSDKDGYTLALSHRPLKSNEIMEITIEKKHSKVAHSIGIGLTTESPNVASTFMHINNIVNMSWALYDGKMFQNGKQILESYGINVQTLSVGARVGVMRSNTGSLHFFVNGEDQGPAASNVPYPIYGVVELRGHAVMATIVDH